MKADSILKADVLDIIFDNRNKDYGAYTLRKFYKDRLYKALGITFALIALLLLYTLFGKQHRHLVKPELETMFASILPDAVKPVEPIKPVQPEKPKQPITLKPVTTQVYVSQYRIVSDNNNVSKLNALTDDVAISNITNDAPGAGKQVVHADPAPQTNTVDAGLPVKTTDKTKPVTNPEFMPEFPGGEAALIKFLQRNLQNPEAMEDGEMVTVKVSFIVGYDGVLKGFEIVQDGGAAFNNEVIRVLKKMPAWKPGKTAGENVAVYYSIPVKFVPRD